MNQANTSLYPAQNTTEPRAQHHRGIWVQVSGPCSSSALNSDRAQQLGKSESAQQSGENLEKGKLGMLLWQMQARQ